MHIRIPSLGEEPSNPSLNVHLRSEAPISPFYSSIFYLYKPSTFPNIFNSYGVLLGCYILWLQLGTPNFISIEEFNVSSYVQKSKIFI